MDPLALARIEALAAGFVERCVTADLRGAAFQRLLAEVGEIGEREIVATAALSRRLVDRPRRAISALLDAESPIARNLAELREAVEDLDPERLGRAVAGRGGGRGRRFLGLIPHGDPAREALERSMKVRARVDGILGSLSVARGALQAEIAAIGQEQRALATEIETLRQYAELARILDERLEARLAALAEREPERAQAIRTDILYEIRQRRRDLLIQLAVATQGAAALRVVQDNNQQVVRTIRMATTTTAAALRTSMAVAQAMADHRQIIDQLRSVRTDRPGSAGGSVEPLTAAATDLDRAAALGADVAGLKRGWDTVFATLDKFDMYSVSAITAMRAAVEELAEEAERSRAALEADRALGDEGEAGPDAADVPSLPPRG